MKIYIITGEQSGDLHASSLVDALKSQYANLEFRAWGGEELKRIGVPLAKHIKETAFMGGLEVIRNLRKISKNLTFCKDDILAFKPDRLVLIDYPGFNLKIAKFAKKHNIHTTYYIPPKIWAWNQRRIKKIRRYIDKLLVVFPFEVDFYKQFDIKAEYVGNPLFDVLPDYKSNQEKNSIIALFPGSRKQEVEKILPEMLKVVDHFKDYHFKVAATNLIDKNLYKRILGSAHVEVCYDDSYNLLNQSRVALVASGTATLETALLNVPQVVCYKTSWITYLLAKIFIRIKYISLVNILMDREVVEELIQNQLNTKNLIKSIQAILDNPIMLEDYNKLRKLLAGKKASENSAKLILEG